MLQSKRQSCFCCFALNRPQQSGRIKKPDATFLDAYNCDHVPLPKPKWAYRARKQIYRADYALQRFIHYSTVTKGLIETYAEYLNRTSAPDRQWKPRYVEATERVVDELMKR